MPSHAHFHLLSSCSSSTYCLCCQNKIGSRALIWKKSQWEGETLAVLWLSTALFKQTKTTNISVRENIDSCHPSGHLKEYIYIVFFWQKKDLIASSYAASYTIPRNAPLLQRGQRLLQSRMFHLMFPHLDFLPNVVWTKWASPPNVGRWVGFGTPHTIRCFRWEAPTIWSDSRLTVEEVGFSGLLSPGRKESWLLLYSSTHLHWDVSRRYFVKSQWAY